MKNYTFYEDGAHGWLRVSKARCSELGILGKITSFSMATEKYLYLEEDKDMTTFAAAMQIDDFAEWFDANVEVKYNYNDSHVRNYPAYRGGMVWSNEQVQN